MVRIYICINVVSAKLNADGQPYPPTTAQPTAMLNNQHGNPAYTIKIV
jgi:hypothetical protein